MKYKKHFYLIACTLTLLPAWASALECSDSTRAVSAAERKKWAQQGHWAGFGAGTGIFMHHADGAEWDAFRLLSDQVVFEAPQGWHLETANVSSNWRLEANPIEYRQRILGNLVGITTGVGVDWWRFDIDAEYRWQPDTQAVVVENVGSGEVLRNRVNMGWVRIPLLASVRTAREADKGLHVEAGAVAGYRVFGGLVREYKSSGSVTRESSNDLAFNTFQLNARVLVGIRKVSVFAEVPLLPLFTSPSDHFASVGTLGLHVAMH
jgi:hypothetical protein